MPSAERARVSSSNSAGSSLTTSTSFSQLGTPIVSFQREDVATTLKVTPRVNSSNYVTLEISIEVSEVEDNNRGLDVNQAMLAYARSKMSKGVLANAQVRHGDIYALALPDGVADAVVMHQVLHFLSDPPLAIREAARVARFCIFHSVPVFDHYRTTYLSKYAYGAPVVEVVFGKQELMSLCSDAGLRLMREWPGIAYDVYDVTGHHSSAATYLFAR